MALFTVNRYLGESPLELGQSSKSSILDKINAKAKEREEQRKQTPSKETPPSKRSKVKGQTQRRTEKDELTPSTDSGVQRKKKRRSFIEKDCGRNGQGEVSTGDVGQESEKNDGKDDDVISMEITNNAMVIPKKTFLHDGKASEKTKKKKGKRKHDAENKKEEEEDINETSENARLTDEGKEEDREIQAFSPSHIKGKKETLKSLKKKKRLKEIKKKDENQTSDEDEENKQMEVVTKDDEEVDDGSMIEGAIEAIEEHHDFVVLGDFERKHKKKVYEALPDWLARPSIIKQSLTNDLQSVTSIKGLDERLVTALTEMGVDKLFPVQQHVIPILLKSLQYGIHTGHAGYRPSDLCISAPTGSGKTLAYAIPIIQALIDRVVCQVRALIVLPTRDLATQVYKIVSSLCKATPLRPVLIGGIKKFSQEQSGLVKEIDGEFHSLADIVIATPGRLVDNLCKTVGFNLHHLRFLVIDEADRLMEHISQDWIAQVEKSAYTPQSDNGIAPPSFTSIRQRPGPLTVRRSSAYQLPLQKLLFSATLSQNPEKLTQLRLFQPHLITTATSSKATPTSGLNLDREKDRLDEEGEDIDEGRSDFVGKYTTPVGLSEYYVQCTAGEKPLVLKHFLINLYFKQVLCFTNSVQTTHRLYLLLKLMGGVDVAEFSSNLSQAQRQNILKQFKAGKIQILICSDAMARGMDIENVRCVISYDLPPHLKTYIHRVGRTARAGRGGTAFSFVRKKEVNEFKHMLRNAGKDGIQRHTVSSNHLEALTPSYSEALSKLSTLLREEKAHQL
ncbi:ATP-dependent RNA helicase DDX51-like [Lytechinus variegatus]|uniref:ATP-dependent RNA helicase DDX51-like n=1 Tax=Lytechinus variegatus TaxID=7654 RepID=UPI001BB1C160|nr:ATP-dependent RNA helicase DDX51-like [Lytechinus variegatus]